MHTQRASHVLQKYRGWSVGSHSCGAEYYSKTKIGFKRKFKREKKRRRHSSDEALPKCRFVSPLIINNIFLKRHVVTLSLFYYHWSAAFPQSVLWKTNTAVLFSLNSKLGAGELVDS